MKVAKNILVFMLLSLGAFSCSQLIDNVEPEQNGNNTFPIPDSIIYKANNTILSKVGRTFFESYIRLDSNRSRFSPPDSFCIAHPSGCAEFLLHPHYYMTYKFSLVSDSINETFIELVLDSNGVLVNSRKPFGIPACPDNDCEGRFRVTARGQAVEIAKQNNFEEGIKPWLVSFHFHAGNFNNYVWEIRSTTFEEKSDSSNYRAGGKTMLIDAMSGAVYKISEWMMLAD